MRGETAHFCCVLVARCSSDSTLSTLPLGGQKWWNTSYSQLYADKVWYIISLTIAKRLSEHLRLDFSKAISFFFGSSSLILQYITNLTSWKALVLKFSKLVITFLGKIIYNRLYFIVVGVGLYLELKRSSFVVVVFLVVAVASWVSALSLLLSSHTFMQMMGSKGKNEIQIQ